MTPDELEVKHSFATVNGLRMHYVEKGHGPVVVLLHGFPENWWSWRYQIDAIANAGFRVVAPDLRGYNETEQRGPYDLATLAADIRALILHLGVPNARVVGHDWGGAVAWQLAATAPDVVERLTILNCPHPAQMLHAFRTRPSQLRRSWYMFFFALPVIPDRWISADGGALVAKIFRGGSLDRSHYGDVEIAPFMRALSRPGAASAALSYYRTSLKLGLLDPGAVTRLPKITARTLLIWAKDDTALGYDDLVPGTERWVPSLQIETIDRCGHFLQSERPEAVNEKLLRFLRETTEEATAP